MQFIISTNAFFPLRSIIYPFCEICLCFSKIMLVHDVGQILLIAFAKSPKEAFHFYGLIVIFQVLYYFKIMDIIIVFYF